MKRCLACKVLKPLSEFHRNRRSADGAQARCKPCNIEINRQWYRAHPEARALRMDAYAKARRRRAQRRLLEYLLAHPCVDCGEADPIVLDFDHLRDKRKNVSAMVTHSWSAIAAEIEKCEVVCANCHRRRTAMRGNYFRATYGQTEADGAPPTLIEGA